MALTAMLMAGEMLPRTEAEERTLYRLYRAPAARARGSELVAPLASGHHAPAYLTGGLQPGRGAGEAAAVAVSARYDRR